MKLVIALVLLVVVTLVFHFASPWWFTPIASNWAHIDTTVDITFWVTGIVFVAVNLFVAYAIYRYRYRKDRKAAYEPENKKLEMWLIVVTSIGVAAMLAPGLVVWADFIDPPEGAAEMEVVARQWDWSFRFPGDDGKLGLTEPRFVSASNPLGIDPKDSAGQDDIVISANEVVLPVDQPVKVLLRSLDVLHNFTVPQVRAKMDMVPGMVTYMWFTPIRTGSFDLLCEELCGIGHYAMRGRIVVVEQADFHTWLATQPTFADTQQFADGDPAAGQALYAVCGACHGQQGEGNADLNAPQLAGQGEWYLKRQLNNYRHGIRGADPEDVFGQQMAGIVATLPDDIAVSNVSAYIGTLPHVPAVSTIEGDPVRGRAYYVTCGTCHGPEAEGNAALAAPRLAGQQDWYLKRQLEQFKSGVRGVHPKDEFGVQMMLMSRTLKDDQAINDVIAYINTLKPDDES